MMRLTNLANFDFGDLLDTSRSKTNQFGGQDGMFRIKISMSIVIYVDSAGTFNR